MNVMRLSQACRFIVAVVVAHCLSSGGAAQCGFVPLVAQDATQPSPNPQDDFEEVLSGNATSLLTGQYLNAFSGPSSVLVNYDVATNSTTIHYAGNAIAGGSSYNTFGYAINAVIKAPGGPIINPGNNDAYWTPGVTVPGHVPEQNIAAQSMPTTHQALITISNDPGTFSLSDVGYLVTNAPFALTSLNRNDLPPSAFVSSGVPDGTTLGPGGSTAFLISGINPGQYVTVFSDAQWSGPSSSDFYQDLSGSWLEFQAVPEPESWMLALAGIVTLLSRVVPVPRGHKAAPGSLSRSKDLS
jgi:hypothetical protein